MTLFFANRHDAGKQLAKALKKYKENPNTIIIALPRGGVVLGKEVADALHLPLDVICPRKIGAPEDLELAIGAVTESGDAIFNEELLKRLHVTRDYLKQEIEKEKKVANARIKLYRGDRAPISFKNQTIILVDDGLATGATMKAAIHTARNSHAHAVVVAVPVSPKDTASEIEKLADAFICLDTPVFFEAVGQFYGDFSPVADEDVMKLLK